MEQLIVVALATWQAIEIWHHGSLFDAARARAAKSSEAGDLLGRVLTCPFCLAPWMAAIMLVLWNAHLPSIIPIALAAARLAQVGNDLAHRYCRTPRPVSEEEHISAD